MKCSGIVIAGGQSLRMGKRKLKQFMIFKKKPLIIHSISNLSPLCDEIIISVKNYKQKEKLVPMIKKYSKKNETAQTRIVLDIKNEFSGPLNGIISSFSEITNELVIITPTDTPFISPQVNKLLKDLVISRKTDTATLIDQKGNISTLNVAIKNPKKRLKQITEIIEEKIEYNLPIRAGDLILTGNNIILLKPPAKKQWILHNINRISDFKLANQMEYLFYKDESPLEIKQFSILEIHNIPLDKILRFLKNDKNEFFLLTNKLLEIWAPTHFQIQLKKDFDTIKGK